MAKPKSMSRNPSPRRDFIKKSLIGFGGFVFLQRCSMEPNYWKYLSNKEGALLEAIAEQFIPSDDGPGAQEACVVNFIDTQLTKNYILLQQRYRSGLKAFQETCNDLMKHSFEKLNAEKKIEFLERMEINDVPQDHWPQDKPSSFFSLMLSHSMQGFYGDPRHGGNCNHVSYAMIDLKVIQYYQPEISGAV